MFKTMFKVIYASLATAAGRQASVCSECHGTTDICHASSWPHKPIAAESPLAAGCWSYYISIDGTHRCLHSSTPKYLTIQLQRVSDVDSRHQLHSSSSTALVTSRTSQTTIGGRCFSAAATSVWNSLPEAVHYSAFLVLLRKTLETKLFAWSYTD